MQETINKLLAPGKGILAADESLGTIEKRFAAVGLPNTHETRRAYRELLFSTSGLEEYISGIVQFDETFREKILKNDLIVPIIKVNFSPDLEKQLEEYKQLGAKAAKMRSVLDRGASDQEISVVAIQQTEYARICQKIGLVPMVEPEVLGGDAETTEKTLRAVFDELSRVDVDFGVMILKPNMILPGSPEEVAKSTLDVFSRIIPDKLPGVAFLSGGQSEEEATANLAAINKLGKQYPWKLTFSFGRALQNSALKTWTGQLENVADAQKKLLERCKANSAALQGVI